MVYCVILIYLMSRGKKARKGEKQKGGKKSQASEGAPTSPTEEKGEEVFIPPPTQVRENGNEDRLLVIRLKSKEKMASFLHPLRYVILSRSGLPVIALS